MFVRKRNILIRHRWAREFLVLLTIVATQHSLAEAQNSETIRIKLGTLIPSGSSWYLILEEMGQQWKKDSDGEVQLTIYPSGVAGDEPAIVRKMRIGQLQAATITTVGLSTIDPSVTALSHIPLLYGSYEELDYVQDHLAAQLSERLEEKGFKVLHWGDAGWIYYFTKRPMTHPDELKTMKLFQWGGDVVVTSLRKSLGLNPVSLSATDIPMGLQSGMIDAMAISPLTALSHQWFAMANHMADLKWAPLNGATVITRKAWNKIPEDHQRSMLEAARRAGKRLKDEIREQNRRAIDVMEEHGLIVHHVDAEAYKEWERFVHRAYPIIRGKIVPRELFDQAVKLRNDFRNSDD